MTPIIQKSVESLVEVLQKRADTGKSFEFFKYIVYFEDCILLFYELTVCCKGIRMCLISDYLADRHS